MLFKLFYFRPMFFLLLYVELKDSDNNLTSHFLELFQFIPVIIINIFKTAEKLHIFSFECKLVVQETAHLKRKRKDVFLIQTLLIEPQTKTLTWSSIAQEACASLLHLHGQRRCVEKKWTVEFGESTRKLGLKMTNRTHIDERKREQFYYFVSGCVLSIYYS